MMPTLAVTLAEWPRRETGSGRKPEWREIAPNPVTPQSREADR